MALTRRALKAMGIDEEKIDEIISMHTETVDGLKAEVAKYKADSETLPDIQKQLEKAQADLEASKKDSWKTKFDALKEDYEAYKEEQTKRETHAAKEKAMRDLLKAIGISEKRLDSVLRVTDVDSIELDDEGKIKDSEKMKSDLKTEWEDFIPTAETRGASTATPPASGRTTAKTKEEIINIKDAGERQKAIAENPSLFGIG